MKALTSPVYFFGNGTSEGDPSCQDLLGGKGAGLCEMTQLGIPVPPGFIISTEVCVAYYQNQFSYPADLKEKVYEKLKRLESVMGAKLGDIENPLLVSVRSGARVSMPGMMDTILNLGLNDQTVEGLLRRTQNPRFAYDSYRRFIHMYGNVVLGIQSDEFEDILKQKKKKNGVEKDTELDAAALKEIVLAYQKRVKDITGTSFPQDPYEQLWGAIGAVFRSWNSNRAIAYRKIHHISNEWGTAVTVQAMVFGNMGQDSATGVAFPRNPATGEKGIFGEYLINAQGEDVVAGIRTPQALAHLKEDMPGAYDDLLQIFNRLEAHYRDMQDIEFTIQDQKVWVLQARSAKRTATAAIRTAVEMVQEKMISKKEAVLRISPLQIEQLLHPMVDPASPKQVLAKGLPASPGGATGQVVFSPDEAEKWAAAGKKVILVRMETSPEDIHGMYVAQGILTARGGSTSHAAVVARGMGKCCVVGCDELHINLKQDEMELRGKKIKKGELITLNGTTGEAYAGKVPTIQPKLDETYQTLMQWVDEIRTLKVRANADTPHDAKVAIGFGVEGIGLCRTEHMFFDETRIDAMREMILVDRDNFRKRALDKLMPMQKADFIGIFKEMRERPVTIRLLDPPLDEFLPKNNKELLALSKKLDLSFSWAATNKRA